MNPNLDWSDDDYIYSSDVPARLPTEAEHAAWLAEQEARIARAALNRKPFIKHVNLPESGDWVDDPFADIKFPFGAFLEPAGYATIQAMRKPNTRSYRRHMPRTTALARTIYDALPEVDVWGRQRPKHEAAWETITAGEWVQGVSKGRPYGFQQKPMAEWDILKMLTDPDSRSLANKDTLGGKYSRVRHIRIDIDMDDVFQYDGEDHFPELQAEIALVHEVFSAFGLGVQIFRTGNRGIQAVASTPFLDRSAAWVLTECVRTVLGDSRRRTWDAADFQTSLQGLMRLPFGLHRWSGSLALFLSRDGGILPVDDQVTAFVDAFVSRPEDYDAAWAEEMRSRLGPTDKTPSITLAEVVAEFPRSSLVRTFLSACDQFDVEGWEKQSVTHTKGGYQQQALDGTESAMVSATGAEPGVPSESVTHTKGEKENNGNGTALALRSSTLGASPAKLKQIGWDILNAGFEPGASFEYYVNVMKGVKGKNAIGWALVVHDGDREAAKAWLDEQAERVGGSTADIVQRKALTAWGVENNDTHERFQQRKIAARHREFHGKVTEIDTEAAQRIVSVLPALRQERDDVKRKTFRQDSLVVIGHILELMMAAARESPEGLIPVSDRTLAAEISRRWPEAATNAMTVSRQMAWVTKGHADCLIGALEVVEAPKKVTLPTVYKLGLGLVA